jgi:hypothetical protein
MFDFLHDLRQFVRRATGELAQRIIDLAARLKRTKINLQSIESVI